MIHCVTHTKNMSYIDLLTILSTLIDRKKHREAKQNRQKHLPFDAVMRYAFSLISICHIYVAWFQGRAIFLRSSRTHKNRKKSCI